MNSIIASCSLPPTNNIVLLESQTEILEVNLDKSSLFIRLFFRTLHAFPEHVTRPVLISNGQSARPLDYNFSHHGFCKETSEMLKLDKVAFFDPNDRLQLACGLKSQNIKYTHRARPLSDATDLFVTWEVCFRIFYRVIRVPADNLAAATKAECDLNSKVLAVFPEEPQATWSRKYTLMPSEEQKKELAATPNIIKQKDLPTDWLQGEKTYLFFASAKFF